MQREVDWWLHDGSGHGSVTKKCWLCVDLKVAGYGPVCCTFPAGCSFFTFNLNTCILMHAGTKTHAPTNSTQACTHASDHLTCHIIILE